MPQIKVFLLASGAIAVRTLAALMAAASVRLMGVGTQPDRRQGRRGFAPTPIGAWCEQHQQPIAKIENVNDPAVIDRIAACAPDIVLVFAFGQLLRSQLLELPTKACVNLHASLLPAYRGAAPINAAILNGDSVTGISVTQMERGLDSGPVYSRHNGGPCRRITNRPAMSQNSREMTGASTFLDPPTSSNDRFEPIPLGQVRGFSFPPEAEANGLSSPLPASPRANTMPSQVRYWRQTNTSGKSLVGMKPCLLKRLSHRANEK